MSGQNTELQLSLRRRQHRRDQRGTGHVGQQQTGVVLAAGADHHHGSGIADATPFDVRPSSFVLPGPPRERLRDVRPPAVHGRQMGEEFTVFRVASVQRPGMLCPEQNVTIAIMRDTIS